MKLQEQIISFLRHKLYGIMSTVAEGSSKSNTTKYERPQDILTISDRRYQSCKIDMFSYQIYGYKGLGQPCALIHTVIRLHTHPKDTHGTRNCQGMILRTIMAPNTSYKNPLQPLCLAWMTVDELSSIKTEGKILFGVGLLKMLVVKVYLFLQQHLSSSNNWDWWAAANSPTQNVHRSLPALKLISTDPNIHPTNGM